MKKSLLLPAALVCLGVSSYAYRSPAPHPLRPKLVLAIIADQFRFDYTTRFRSEYTGGLARMMDHGAVFADAHQDHYPTVTATGHATYMSGSVPATSGIINNEWYDRTTGKVITSVEDHETKLLGVSGDRTGSSPHNLIVSTLGDEIKMAGYGDSKTIGISMKDRAAILPAGRMADASYWLDAKSGNVVSSTYYMPQLPQWVQSFNGEKLPSRSLGKTWSAGSNALMTLPSTMGPEFLSKWEETPYSSEMLETLAENAIKNERLGHHDGTDLLTVSFSANDHLGHAVGPDSPAVKELSIQTDRIIGKLLDAAEQAAGGKENLVVVFSADHGVAPVPEVMTGRHMPGGRIDKKQYLKTINDGLASRFGEGQWIAGAAEAGVYLNYELLKKYNVTLDKAEDAVSEIAQQMPLVARTYTAHQFDKHEASASEIDDLVARGYFRGRSPDVIVVMRPYYLFGTEGTSHGTPYNYDTHVPLVFYGGNIQAGTYYSHVGISDVAPTLAALLRVQMPSGSVGHVLPEVLNGGAQSEPNVNTTAHLRR